MEDVLAKRIKFNHNGTTTEEIFGIDFETLLQEGNEDYQTVYVIMRILIAKKDYALLLATTIEGLISLKFDKVSNLVEYLYRSMDMKSLRKLASTLIYLYERQEEEEEKNTSDSTKLVKAILQALLEESK
jgi:hypothetical protein